MTPPRILPTSALLALLFAALGSGCSTTDEAMADQCGGRIGADNDPACWTSERWAAQWQEARTVLPPAPRAEDLLRIEAPSAHAGFEYFIDRRSLRLGTDGVMRYTVVARSPAGATNAFHEGLRCFDDTVRTYGFASSDGVLRPVAREEWHLLATRGARGYQNYLGNVIMCDRQGHAWEADKAIEALQAQYTAGGVRIERPCMNQESCGPHNRHD